MIVARVEKICAPGSHGANLITVPEEVGTFVFPEGEPSEIEELWQSALTSAYGAMGVERETYTNGSGVIGSA